MLPVVLRVEVLNLPLSPSVLLLQPAKNRDKQIRQIKEANLVFKIIREEKSIWLRLLINQEWIILQEKRQ